MRILALDADSQHCSSTCLTLVDTNGPHLGPKLAFEGASSMSDPTMAEFAHQITPRTQLYNILVSKTIVSDVGNSATYLHINEGLFRWPKLP